MTGKLGVARAVVDGRMVPGDVVVGDDGRVAEVGVAAVRGRGTGMAVAGFVDLQVNGFAGVDFLAADGPAYERAGRALAATGVTAYQPTFISSPIDVYLSALATVRELTPPVGSPRVIGVHLEGPFLSPRRHGAHRPDLLRSPDGELTRRLLRAGPVTTMTIAPELPGALELIGLLRSRGVIVALGHSEADRESAHAGFDAGATTVTHVFNAMPPFSHREPGLAGVALARPDVTVQVIVDHVHLARETVAVTWAACVGRFALVTDAVAAAGVGPGRHRLGDRDVIAGGGAVRLDDGTLAGSLLTMDQAVRNLIEVGAPVEQALAAAGAVPADVVGRSDLGRLAPGQRADIVVLDDGLAPVRTLIEGVEAYAR